MSREKSLTEQEVAAASAAFGRLVTLVATLRGPNGCPWDQVQTRESVTPYLLEESYEVLDAIQAGDQVELKEELGDLMFQVLFHSDMSSDDGIFDITGVVDHVHDKMVYRHPHVFGDEVANTADDVLKNWELLKAKEPGKQHRKSVLDGVPRSLPALLRADKMAKKAAKVGFDWSQAEQVWDKVHEELDELKEAMAAKDMAAAQDELGDVLFALVNLGRKSGLSADEALTGTIERFYGRFSHMERHADAPLKELSADQWESLWDAAKAEQQGRV